MKNLKIFPKMFLQIFSVLGVIILLIHLFVFFIFPKTYLETRKGDIAQKADEISSNLNGKERAYVNQCLDFFSKTSEIQASIQEENGTNEIEIGKDLDVDLDSEDNSLIIEEREILLDSGQKIALRFISTANMQKDARDLSFKFLPYSLLVSFLFSIVVSLLYAKMIKNNIQEIKQVTDQMMEVDKEARLRVDSNDEIGQLKSQINDLYETLLKALADAEEKNQEILKLEQVKYDFFRGASHDLKTPLASLKIILENMKYKIGKYKDRDLYIQHCLDIVDDLSQSISQILTLSSLDRLKNDEEVLVIQEVLEEVLKKYEVLANQKKIRIHQDLDQATLYIGKTALKIILSNLVSNAVKYTQEHGVINIGREGDWFYIENSCEIEEDFDLDRVFEMAFDLNKENSHGLGLYIVRNLLDNYQINYQVQKSEIGFVFKIQVDHGKEKIV